MKLLANLVNSVILKLYHMKRYSFRKGEIRLFALDPHSRKPIYEQICDHICQLIALGVWQNGQQLPPVRTLAQELSINHNTIQKSIALLEQQGILETLPGKGTFVHQKTAGNDPIKRRALNDLRAVLEKYRLCGITTDDVLALCTELLIEPSSGKECDEQ